MTFSEEFVDGGTAGGDYAEDTVAAVAQAQTISAGKSVRWTRAVSPSEGFNPLIVRIRHKDEIALYDRQIRLWGVKAQEKYEILLDHWISLKNELAS